MPGILLLSLLLASSQARVQAPAAPEPPATLPSPADTAAPLHQLFAARRQDGHVSLGVRGITIAIASQSRAYDGLATLALGAVGAVSGVVVLTGGAVRALECTAARERRVPRAWQQRLPRRWVRRALVPEYMPPPNQK